jgi:hypothetical protein
MEPQEHSIKVSSQTQTSLVELYRTMNNVLSKLDEHNKNKVKLVSENEGVDITVPIFSLIHVINRKADEYVYRSTGIDFHKLVDEEFNKGI